MTDLARVTELISDVYAALSVVLDSLSAAVVFVDGSGRLVHANAPAALRLAGGDVLGWADGKPTPRNEAAAAHLRAILSAATQGAAPGPRTFSATLSTPGGERVTLQIIALSTRLRPDALGSCAAAAAILVSSCGAALAQRIESAARLYDFTPAETRVVQTLLGGCTIVRAAAVLGIAEATVKTHLQHVYDKTGARRQVDLVQLIAEGGAARTAGDPVSLRGRDGFARTLPLAAQ